MREQAASSPYFTRLCHWVLLAISRGPPPDDWLYYSPKGPMQLSTPQCLAARRWRGCRRDPSGRRAWELTAECPKLGRCPLGEARLYGGYVCRPRMSSHTIGQSGRMGCAGSNKFWKAAIAHASASPVRGDFAVSHFLLSRAFCRFPHETAAHIAVTTVGLGSRGTAIAGGL